MSRTLSDLTIARRLRKLILARVPDGIFVGKINPSHGPSGYRFVVADYGDSKGNDFSNDSIWEIAILVDEGSPAIDEAYGKIPPGIREELFK